MVEEVTELFLLIPSRVPLDPSRPGSKSGALAQFFSSFQRYPLLFNDQSVFLATFSSIIYTGSMQLPPRAIQHHLFGEPPDRKPGTSLSFHARVHPTRLVGLSRLLEGRFTEIARSPNRGKIKCS